MLRTIIHIDEKKCNGCGACAAACHEGAIGMVDGKAKLLRDDYCDGLGNCLPHCPTGAITFVEREAAAYDEEAVKEHQLKKALEAMDGGHRNGGNCHSGACHSDAAASDAAAHAHRGSAHHDAVHGMPHGGCPGSRVQFIHREAEASEPAQPGHGTPPFGGCPGSRMQVIRREQNAGQAQTAQAQAGFGAAQASETGAAPSPSFASPYASPYAQADAAYRPVSALNQWPVQIKLVPVNAPYFNGAKLLIAADCTAYAYAAFHQDFLQGKICLIGCPKLDDADYSEKLTEIIRNNDIRSVTIVRMEVPCCGGLEHAAVTALKNSGKFIPWQVATISIDGRILD